MWNYLGVEVAVHEESPGYGVVVREKSPGYKVVVREDLPGYRLAVHEDLPGYRVVVHEQPGELGASHLSVMPENAAGEDEDEPLAAQVAAACNKASTDFQHQQSAWHTSYTRLHTEGGI